MKQVKADDKHMECNYNRRYRDRLWIRIKVVTWENCGCFLSISNFQTLPADNNLQSVAFGSVDRQDCCEILYSLLCLSKRCLYFAVNQILSVNLSANVDRIFGFCNPPEPSGNLTSLPSERTWAFFVRQRRFHTKREENYIGT